MAYTANGPNPHPVPRESKEPPRPVRMCISDQLLAAPQRLHRATGELRRPIISCDPSNEFSFLGDNEE